MNTRIFTALLAITASQAACSNPKPAVTPSHLLQTESMLGRPLYARSPGALTTELEADLAEARRKLAAAPDDPARIVWVGRRLGYLWRMKEAIEVHSDGLVKHPDYAPLYRHRGHRYISLRQFDAAIADLQRAAALIEGAADEVEPDGMPNARNVPLTTTAFNVWYHLGLARYLKADYKGALAAYQETMKYTRGLADNIVAVTDWTYMTLRRLGKHEEAQALLAAITPDMEIIENSAYHQRLLMYKGLVAPTDLLATGGAADLDVATQGYGVGAWYLANGKRGKAVHCFQRVVSSTTWPAFGFIAAEVDLKRLRE